MHFSDLQKLWRFSAIYGPRRAAFKAAARMRRGSAKLLTFWPKRDARDIGVIGCGQFAFATIGYVVTTQLGHRFAAHYDIEPHPAETFAHFFGSRTYESADAIIADPGIKTVYIASNHASHSDYAIAALIAGKEVYVEKPVAVTRSQLAQLMSARREASGQIYAGYNRPFSKAIRDLRPYCQYALGPLTLICTIFGHQIAPDHWYRKPEEGTRICGNIGHWLDLAVHILKWNELPEQWSITCIWSNPQARDDDLIITLTSARGDLISIVMTSRNEPFEGIAETILLQWGEVNASIEDFRSLTIRKGSLLERRRYWPKDVGHVRALLQPFEPHKRNFEEVELSSHLMLAIADMVRNGTASSSFDFKKTAAVAAK